MRGTFLTLVGNINSVLSENNIVSERIEGRGVRHINANVHFKSSDDINEKSQDVLLALRKAKNIVVTENKPILQPWFMNMGDGVSQKKPRPNFAQRPGTSKSNFARDVMNQS